MPLEVEQFMNRLLNKVVLITGSARGIGKATAELCHAEGASVIVTDINDQAGAAVASQFPERAEYHSLNVSQEADWQKVFHHIEQKYDHLDALVNNAGIGGAIETTGPHNPEYLDLDSWRYVHAVNSDGVALGCKYAIQLMKQNQKGSIVNISSRAGVVGIPHMTAYAASKAAVRNHTKSVALYCAEMGYNIRCNSIHPGAILTPMWDPILGEGEERDAMIRELSSQVPLGRMGSPLDVAYAVVYFASDESAYVTGAELHIDGGILAGSEAAPAARSSQDHQSEFAE
jgi:NAD(P)-dependent dehydrogenase (short-subunit alcohol dehydrogenase family)